MVVTNFQACLRLIGWVWHMFTKNATRLHLMTPFCSNYYPKFDAIALAHRRISKYSTTVIVYNMVIIYQIELQDVSMAAFFNHYSFFITIAFLLLGSGVILWRMRRGTALVRLGAWLAIMVIMVAIWLLLRPSPNNSISSLAEADSLIGNDTPTVVYLYSQY